MAVKLIESAQATTSSLLLSRAEQMARTAAAS
jgi:hypothetical protein